MNKGFDWKAVEKILCERMCANIRIHQREDGFIMLDTPFRYPDGDNYSIYLLQEGAGIRLSDKGNALMRYSYGHDVDNLLGGGSRKALLDEIIKECKINFNQQTGEFFIDSSIDNLSNALFFLGQALTKIYDISFLSRNRVRNTFYEDLEKMLTEIVGNDRIQKEYIVPKVENAQNYPVDYCINGVDNVPPLFLYGIPDKSKARLATICLQHLTSQTVIYRSLLVFENQESISRGDLARLSDAGGAMVSSINQRDTLEHKIKNLRQ